MCPCGRCYKIYLLRLLLRRASRPAVGFTDRIASMSVTTTLSSLLSRNTSRPGVSGTARVDRDIDRLLRRVGPGDIVVMDALDLGPITPPPPGGAQIGPVVNASPSISGRYPNLGPEVLVANGVVLIDEAGTEVFKKVKDGAK